MQFTRVNLDANHLEIVRALKLHGYGVTDLAAAGNGIADLFVSCPRTKITVAQEIKIPGGGGRLKLSQLKFLATFKGYAAFVSTTDEALKIMKDPAAHSLSDDYKTAILKFLIRWEPLARQKQKTTNPQILVKTFEAEMAKILNR